LVLHRGKLLIKKDDVGCMDKICITGLIKKTVKSL
jgi:hypothetical protein